MKTNMSFRIDDAMRKQLNQAAKDSGLQVSDMVREALSQYLAAARFRKLRKKVLPFSESQGLLSDDDVFKALS